MGKRCAFLLVAVVVALLLPATAHAALFKTPSGNVSCGTGPNAGGFAIVCTVFSEANANGQKLWAMRRRGRPRVFRSKSNAATQVRVLRYGQTYRGFGIRCRSRKRALRCDNRSGHGFSLSKERQRVF